MCIFQNELAERRIDERNDQYIGGGGSQKRIFLAFCLFFPEAHSRRRVDESSKHVVEGEKKTLANISVNYVLQLSFINLITER